MPGAVVAVAGPVTPVAGLPLSAVPSFTARPDCSQRAVHGGSTRTPRPALAIAGPSFATGGHAVGRPTEANSPAALANLELTETCRPELRDQRRQELLAETVDGGVIGRALLGGSFGGAVPRLGGFGHGLDLLASGRFVTVERGDRGPDGSAAGIEQVAQADPEPAADGRFGARRVT